MIPEMKHKKKIEDRIKLKNKFLNIEKLNLYLELAKVRITFFVAFSTSVGFILAAENFSFEFLYYSFAVFILASGSSALNHYQERRTDALMDRTKNRPLPSGKVSGKEALIFILALFGLGFLLLSFNLIAVLLGVLAIIWYNVIYTPLKRKSAVAVVPGAVVGAIPPAIGWVAAGGYLLDPKLLPVAMFFFIWQVPHFWLLQVIYHKDYEKAGFPTLNLILNDIQISRITFIWIVALAVSCFAIPLFGMVENIYVNLMLVAAGIWLVVKTSKIMFKYSDRLIYKFAFKEVNIYVLLIVLILSVNKIIQLV